MSHFAIITEAGLTQGEFADLVGASRITVNRWSKGQPVSKTFRPRVADLLKRLQVGIKLGLLPGTLSAPARGTTIVRKNELVTALNTIDEQIAAYRRKKQS